MNEIDSIMGRLNFEISHVLGRDRDDHLLAATEDLISKFEEEVGFSLPPIYRAFLQRYGGAYLHSIKVEAPLRDSRLGLDVLLPVQFFFGFYSKHSSKDLFWELEARPGELPPGMIPIASTGCNEVFSMSCLEKSKDRIHYSRGRDFADSEPEEYLFFVAPTFMDFLRSLRPMSKREIETGERDVPV